MKKVVKPDARDGWYEIAPTDAQDWLDRCVKNRPLVETSAARIAKAIENGLWEANGESFILDPQGRLLDGQHRARGIVLANKSVVAYVVHGVPPKAFDTIDQGRARTGSDIAAIMGTAQYVLSAAIAAWAIKYETAWTMQNYRIPNRDVGAWLRKNGSDLEVALRELQDAAPGYKTVITPSIIGFVYFMARQRSKRKALEFAAGVGTGESLSAGSPMLALRNRLAGGKANRHHVMAWTVKAWNAYAAGRSVGLLKHVARNGDGLPRIGEEESAEIAA